MPRKHLQYQWMPVLTGILTFILLIRWQNFTDSKLLLENKFAYCALSVIKEAIAYANRLALESNQAKNSIESKLGIQL